MSFLIGNIEGLGRGEYPEILLSMYAWTDPGDTIVLDLPLHDCVSVRMYRLYLLPCLSLKFTLFLFPWLGSLAATMGVGLIAWSIAQ